MTKQLHEKACRFKSKDNYAFLRWKKVTFLCLLWNALPSEFFWHYEFLVPSYFFGSLAIHFHFLYMELCSNNLLLTFIFTISERKDRCILHSVLCRFLSPLKCWLAMFQLKAEVARGIQKWQLVCCCILSGGDFKKSCFVLHHSLFCICKKSY